MATRKCSDCRKWQYLEEDGPLGKRGEIAERGGSKLLRVLPPNCAACPKESPDRAYLHELSPKNAQAVEFYYVTRAMSGANLTDEMRQDETVQRNMAIIDRILRPFESGQSAMLGMAPMLLGFSKGSNRGGRK